MPEISKVAPLAVVEPFNDQFDPLRSVALDPLMVILSSIVVPDTVVSVSGAVIVVTVDGSTTLLMSASIVDRFALVPSARLDRFKVVLAAVTIPFVAQPGIVAVVPDSVMLVIALAPATAVRVLAAVKVVSVVSAVRLITVAGRVRFAIPETNTFVMFELIPDKSSGLVNEVSPRRSSVVPVSIMVLLFNQASAPEIFVAVVPVIVMLLMFPAPDIEIVSFDANVVMPVGRTTLATSESAEDRSSVVPSPDMFDKSNVIPGAVTLPLVAQAGTALAEPCRIAEVMLPPPVTLIVSAAVSVATVVGRLTVAMSLLLIKLSAVNPAFVIPEIFSDAPAEV